MLTLNKLPQQHIHLLDYFYYTALTVAALYDSGTVDEQNGWRELLTAHQEQLREWTENCPPTFADKHALVLAEIARIEGRDADAVRLYEQAIQSAHKNGFVQNEGTAQEVAARFYAAHGAESIAHACLRNARHCYLRWGAFGKVRQLEQLHSHLRDAPVLASPIATIGAPVEQLGEPDGSTSERIVALRDALVSAGFDAPIRDPIRWSIWLKLWGNVCFNPISALTFATLDRVTSEPGLRALCKSMMAEAQAITISLGLTIPEQMMERRLNAAGSVFGHKISMLQDLERGRSLEIDALVTAVQEIGRLVKVATPTIDAALALVQERGRQAGLYSNDISPIDGSEQCSD